MRLITGDELGLLKEIVPELCRRREDVDEYSPSSSSSSSSIATKFAGGRSLPSVQRLDLSSSGGDGSSVTNSSSIPGRSAGIVSLAFLPPPLSSSSSSSSSESCFNFAALRSNGIVETWRGTRGGKEQTDNGEADIIPASYIKCDTLTNGVVARSNNGDKNAETSPGHEVSSSNSSGGWYMNRPINPIGMVSSYIINNHARDDTGENNGNPILVTCDSIGGLSIINTNKMNVVAQYETFMADSDTTTTTSTITNIGTSSSQLLQLLPLPSSSKNNPCNIGTLTHTKGARANVDIATCLALTSSIYGGTTALHVAVGGRERGTRLVNVETGLVVWKAKNLPPDSQTLLQRLMWTTSIQFLHGGGEMFNNNVMTCGTAYGQVQLYDVRASSTVRRPTAYTPDNMLSHRITSMCQMGDSANILAVGDTIGDIHLLDIRKLSTGRYLSGGGSKKTNRSGGGGEDIGLGRLAGPGGSIRQLVNHPTKSNVLACVGLDRKLWTWDITKKKTKNGMKKPLDCVYLKQRLHCVLFCEDGDGTENKTDNDYEESGNDVRYDFDDERGSIERGGLTRSRKELEEDAVEDYIDSDDDDNTNDNVNKRRDKSENGLLEEETESESDENGCSDGEDNDDKNVDESDDDDDESSESSGGDDDVGDGNVIASKRRRT